VLLHRWHPISQGGWRVRDAPHRNRSDAQRSNG
jgi:hypothetical protein